MMNITFGLGLYVILLSHKKPENLFLDDEFSMLNISIFTWKSQCSNLYRCKDVWKSVNNVCVKSSQGTSKYFLSSQLAESRELHKIRKSMRLSLMHNLYNLAFLSEEFGNTRLYFQHYVCETKSTTWGLLYVPFFLLWVSWGERENDPCSRGPRMLSQQFWYMSHCLVSWDPKGVDHW